MSIICPTSAGEYNFELIICDCDEAQQAHKELFRFSDKAYVIADSADNIVDAVIGIVDPRLTKTKGHPLKMHLTLTWENLLQISLWQTKKPKIEEALSLLINTGVNVTELQPIKTAYINDIFPYLYYGKHFGILRKVCQAAKKQIEGYFNAPYLRADIHLISGDTRRIIASSL